MAISAQISKFQEMYDNSQNIVFFGGAGVSTESGIPDFRSQDGLYQQQWKYPPETIISRSFFDHNPVEFYRFYREKLIIKGVEPNKAHIALAEMEKAGKLKAVVTQNIDGLHEETGMDKVYAVHGTMSRWYCQDCGYDLYFPNDVLDGNYDNMFGVPKCVLCGGEATIRPDIVLYGEGLAQPAWMNAQVAAGQADLMIVVGSSLTVQPAASLPFYCDDDHMVVINRDPTIADSTAALVFHEDIQDVFNLIEIPEGEV